MVLKQVQKLFVKRKNFMIWCFEDEILKGLTTFKQGGPKLFTDSDRKSSMIPDSRVLESNKSNKLAAIEILRTF